MIAASIRRGLGNLGRFGGRDAHRHFWPYGIVVIFVAALGIGAVMLPPILSAMGRVRAFAEANPDQVTITSGPGGTSMTVHGEVPGLMPDFAAIIMGVGIVAALAVLLLAATVVRRLHDSGRSGWWAAPVPILLATGLVAMVRVMGDPSAVSGGAFALIFLNNLLYLASLGALVVFLLLAGSPGANRYGAVPAD